MKRLRGAGLIPLLLACTIANGAAANSGGTPQLIGLERECYELTLKRIRETGRSYNTARSGFDEKDGVVNVWIGRYLFRIPAGYVNFVSGPPGISAVLVAVLPDMRVAKQPYAELIDGVEPQIYIRLSCAPGLEYARSDFTASRTRDDYIRTYFRSSPALQTLDVPALGLVGYKPNAGTSTLYFPKDPAITNAHGGALAFLCDEPYPPKTVAPRAVCMTRFSLRDGVEVDYRFPEHFMKYWEVGYRAAVRLLTSFLVED